MSGTPPAAAGTRPAWADELARAYMGGAASVFLVHGNLHDVVPVRDAGGAVRDFVSVERYLATQLFGQRDLVLQYDRGSGLSFAERDDGGGPRMREEFFRALDAMDTVLGTRHAASGLKEPRVVLEVLDRFILAKTQSGPAPDGTAAKPRSLAIVLRYAETIAPNVEASWLSGDLGGLLVMLLNWANHPAVRRGDVTICLLVESLAEVNRRLLENPHIAKVEVPLPAEADRHAFVRHQLATVPRLRGAALDAAAVAREANGLTLIGLAQALADCVQADGAVDLARLKRAKRELIEKQCFGLVEFVEPRFDLDMVVAPAPVKQRLLADARLMREGRIGALPMGYLVCGVLGTGKTFTATCFAGTIGIPALVFKNLREKWVGSSEGNMQKVLSVVRALGPVVVIVDEADAALGDRGAEGDSGTSGRLFAMVSSQMADTAYRGKVIWMLLTCRPDLLPVDLKRQGRCEVHIPLFVPQSEPERREMFMAMARKNKLAVDPADVPPLPEGASGADIESLVVQCLREASIAGVEKPTREMIAGTVARFLTPNYSLQMELQELAAVREATDLAFLPERYQRVLRDPEAAAALERRIRELTALLGER